MTLPEFRREGLYVSLAITVLIAIYLALASGCATKQNKEPIPVSIVTPITLTRDPRYCYVDTPPVPPETISTIFEEEDVVRRIFVHIRQYNDLLYWARDVEQWMTQMGICIDGLTEGP